MKNILSIARGVYGLATQRPGVVAKPNHEASAFDFVFKAIDGSDMPLAKFRGKVLLVVNTASFCGYTLQYEGLEALSKSYGSQGLVVIGVPSNDFAGQEPKSESEIQSFCQARFGVSFPLTAKYAVTGPKAHPFYVWARTITGSKGAPKWNFHKLLVGRNGKLVAWFPASSAPASTTLEQSLQAELARPKA